MAERLYAFDDDDDNVYEDKICPPRRTRWIRERENLFEDFDEIDFRSRFRLSKRSALSVLEQIEEKLEFPSDRNYSVSPINQLLTTLRYYATSNTLLSTADFAGMSKATAHRIIHRVSAAIASLRPQHILFPTSPEEVRSTHHGFYTIAKFPRAIGAMDCTHIKIASPGGPNAEVFRNRKGYFSLNVQVICNGNLEITDIVSRWPGSTHDVHIFNSSRRHAFFEEGRYGNSVLLVDGGYAYRPCLMAPLENPRTVAENLYNESQIRTRNIIERLFGVWKRRFPMLALGIRMSLENTIPIIVASAVLHNILRIRGEEDPPENPELQIPAPWEVLLEEGNIAPDGRGQPCRTVRDPERRAFVNYFQSLQLN